MNNKASKFAILDNQYKFIYSPDNSCNFLDQKEELYDVINDPHEEQNLIVTKPEIASRLKQSLLQNIAPYNYPQAFVDGNSQNTPEDIIEKLKGLGY